MEAVIISLLAPVARRRMQRWVEAQVDGLRAQGQGSGIRLGRLVAASPSQGGDWLIEVERDGRDVALEDDIALSLILTELAAIGLRPRLFVVTREPGAQRTRDAHSAGAAAGAARRQLGRHARPACRRSSRAS